MDNTREKILDLVIQGREKANKLCGEQDGCEKCPYQAPKCCAFGVIADHLVANGAMVQKWTPVTEGLPENDYGKHWKERRYYLVRLQYGQMRVAKYGYKENNWWIDSHDCVLCAKHYTEVTHWMLLPQSPKGE